MPVGRLFFTRPMVRLRSNAADQLRALSHLDELFGQHGIEYWLFGGWAVDFHAGKVTRPHDDLDLSQSGHTTVSAFASLLTAAGRRHTPEEGYSVYELDDVRLRSRFWITVNGLRTRSSTRSPRWPGFARVVSLSSLKADKAMVRDDESVAASRPRGLRDRAVPSAPPPAAASVLQATGFAGMSPCSA